MAQPDLTIYPIRHHGPGSARSVGRALEANPPATLLIEGPVDADNLLPFLNDPAMTPPVAVMAHVQGQPERSVFYPLAEFSPEFVAIRWALARGVPVAFMDLPASVTLALGEEGETPAGTDPDADPAPTSPADTVRQDPLALLAQAAGYSDFERWWDALVESRGEGEAVFAAIAEVMAAVREAEDGHTSGRDLIREAQREAQMRQTIRAALKKGSVAVVCGAWHAPALTPEVLAREAKADPARLKGLPKVKVALTLTPWTHGRLTQASGYGAGVTSPGWYAHLFGTPAQVSERWLTRSARLLRGHGLDASSAQVIDAVRLADALATLRGRHLAGLDELTDATRAVFAWDSDTPLRLLSEELFVGEALGTVPSGVPAVPLEQDLAGTLARLRLKREATTRDLTLDLREDAGLNRSQLFHRLNLLGVPWAREAHSSGTGTFKEAWTLRWDPEFSVRIVEASRHGNTLVRAAQTAAVSQARRAPDLGALSALLEVTRLCGLPGAAAFTLARLDARAADADTAALLLSLPPLARLARYGDVRAREGDDLRPVFRTLVARAAAGLPNAAHGLGGEAAQTLHGQIAQADAAVRLLDDPEASAEWVTALHALDAEGTAPLLRGDAVNRLRDRCLLDAGQVQSRLAAALAPGAPPLDVAAWLSGFIGEDGGTLRHDPAVLALLDAWVTELDPDAFGEVLPPLRRALSRLEPHARKRLGEELRGLERAEQVTQVNGDLGARVVPVVLRLLGATLPHGDAQ
ncbi:hypothetical protein DEIPH_ctg046orf0072 [Deinococcus phoenicis]|uniref:Uncharacterized protein n=1 Tax=Deinococcus phoenicis TaxID=1476583 RepID=A0A016QM88_9DEIO|nr:DUF5682 family protein [Deinococcus phoenicis]EYB67265.1 hypothetical protein DEIPH_ctg046orf0072 [Deinococcus phoenicis]